MMSVLTSNRFKSFYWRLAMMILAIVIGETATNLDLFAGLVSPQVIVVLGLVLGEVSKALNNALARK